jgi:hypothetical protein
VRGVRRGRVHQVRGVAQVPGVSAALRRDQGRRAVQRGDHTFAVVDQRPLEPDPAARPPGEPLSHPRRPAGAAAAQGVRPAATGHQDLDPECAVGLQARIDLDPRTRRRRSGLVDQLGDQVAQLHRGGRRQRRLRRGVHRGARGLVHQGHRVAENGGHGVGCTAVHAGVRAAQQQERLAVAPEAAADVAQLGDPGAVVGQLGENGHPLEQRLLAVDPVLQPAGQVRDGTVVAGPVRPVAEPRIRPRRGTGGETRPGVASAHRAPAHRAGLGDGPHVTHSRASRTGRCARAAPRVDPLTRTGRSSCGRHTTGRPVRRRTGARPPPDGAPWRRPSG